MAKQSELTKKYIIDFNRKFDKLIEIYVDVLGERHRPQIAQRLNDVSILFTGTNDKWLQLVRYANGLNKYSIGDQIVPVAPLSKVEKYIENNDLPHDFVTQDCLATFEKIAKNIAEEDKKECIELLSKVVPAYSASCVTLVTKDLKELINYIHYPLALRGKDSVLVHECLHAISTYLMEEKEGVAVFGSGLTCALKERDKPGEIIDYDGANGRYNKLNNLNEMFTEYLTGKVVKEMEKRKFVVLNYEPFVSKYENGLAILSYLFEKIEPEFIDMYVKGGVAKFEKIIGAEQFNQLLELSNYFYENITDLHLLTARANLESVKTVKDMVRFSEQLNRNLPLDQYFKNCNSFRVLTEKIVEKLNRNEL